MIIRYLQKLLLLQCTTAVVGSKGHQIGQKTYPTAENYGGSNDDI